MFRDVSNMFLTSVDKVDDFIYRGHRVPEEFRTKPYKGECRRGTGVAPHMVWCSCIVPWPTRAGTFLSHGFLVCFYGIKICFKIKGRKKERK